jgi:hypothetical protein
VIDEIVIISPELIPGAGGVGDYTLRLIESWDYRGNLKLLVPKSGLGQEASLPQRIEKLGIDAVAIGKQLPSGEGKILVQYSAYGFDRLGYPRKLVRALVEWKHKTRGLLIVMFHEIWTFWPITNKNAIVQFFHRRAIKQLMRCADTVLTTTSSQAHHLKKLTPSRSVHILPVGSNIRRNKDVEVARKPGWAVLFGRQDARIRALKKMQNSLTSLAGARRITKVVTVGATGLNRDEEERSLLANLGLAEGFEQRGPQEERGISELLLTASFGISAQNELSYAKSGTFMAYAVHGLNVLAECAEPAREEPLNLLTSPRELLQGIPDMELRLRAERLRAWQQRTSSWDLIAVKFVEALQLPEASRAADQVVSR